MAIPAIALFGIQAATGIGSTLLELDAGKADQRALEFAAEQEVINARIRQNERLERLVSSMAANNAALGVRGITAQGSPQTILEADFKKASKEAQTDLLDSQTKTISLRSKGANARRMSKIRAATSLLGTAADVTKTGIRVPQGT